MPDHITRVQFRNFKALSNFSLSMSPMSILVGPNNSGKSTILSSFRALESALRRANSRRPELLRTSNGNQFGYKLSAESLPLSLENVHTEYDESDSSITFTLSSRSRLTLDFPSGGGARLFVDGAHVRRPTEFRRQFPIEIEVVPVLGPIEHVETVLNPETVTRSLLTPRASAHFRNYWYHFPDGFDHFAELVRSTWPGMTIERPERVSNLSTELVMICTENRVARELYWSGFGFQIWCQLLTHISRAGAGALLIIDEPEIYLHPDIQRQLLGILRDTGADILVASHSTEIMGEADPSEIVLIDKTKRSGERLRDIEGVQKALDLVGSVQNITLTQLARSQRILFVEGDWDWKVIRRFARKLGLHDVASGTGVTAVESGGFSSRDHITGLAWGFERLLESGLQIGAVFDRDFWPDEEVTKLKDDLDNHIDFVHFHSYKELENYLLSPPILERALESAVHERQLRTGERVERLPVISELLSQLTEPDKTRIQGQYVSRRVQFLRGEGSPRDPSTITTETLQLFERGWAAIDTRMGLVEGKQVLRRLRATIQDECKVSLTDYRIIDAYLPEEVPGDLKGLITAVDNFRRP